MGLQIEKQGKLRMLSTLRVGGVAEYVVTIRSESDIPELIHFLHDHADLVPYIVGGGSNSAFADETVLPIIVIKNAVLGRSVVSQDDESVVISLASGEDWDECVSWSIESGWQGLEALSAIPGSVGATPVQNVGAYGVEVKDLISEVYTYDLHTGEKRVYTPSECAFAYRDSCFKQQPGRYLITEALFKLNVLQKDQIPPVPDYPGVQEEIDALGLGVTTQTIRQAIQNIRWHKLPDPGHIPNLGSFFKNPIVSSIVFAQLQGQYPGIPGYPAEHGYKVPAGWLIDQAGWKGRSIGPAGVYADNALVLVNTNGEATFIDIQELCNAIQQDIKARYGMHLEVEPNLVNEAYVRKIRQESL